jgi:hyperosmotically inducible protein
MKTKLATTCLLMGALIVPVAGHAQDKERDKDRSSPKAWVKDSVITTKVKAKLAAEKPTSLVHIRVDTDAKGMVQLSGNAKSQAEVDRAVSITKGVEGVVSVDNQIKVVKDK